MSDASNDELGERLAAQAPWLLLLLIHLAGRQVRARVEVDDLVQEVFLRVLSNPESAPSAASGDTGLRSFLARVARNTVFDLLRAMRAAKRSGQEVPLVRSDWSIGGGVVASQLAASIAGPATRVSAAEEHRRLLKAFDGLSPEHRRVLGLRQFEGLSAVQAGRRMGRSEVAIHSLYRRALKAWNAAAR